MTRFKYADVSEVTDSVMAAFKPPPKMTTSEWSEKYRRLSPESSASPGKFSMKRIEFWREVYDLVGDPRVKSISAMCSAQVAKSTFLENVIGKMMHLDPCPILHVSPTLSSMEMFSKERLSPMIRDTPVLRNLVKDVRSRDSNNTISSKKFPGGHIAMVGSNAPAGLASRPVRIVLADEVDRFERSAGTEGDPLKLAIKRTTTYWNRIIIMVSTPGDKYNPQTKTGSRIEKEFLEGDQRYLHCPCPDCGYEQRLVWSQVLWDDGDPETARYVCEECGSEWNDVKRNAAVEKGKWVATKPFNGRVSVHLSQLYSPFARLADGVRDFLDSKDDQLLLKTWVNTFLGESWEDRGERLEWSNLLDQREDYNCDENIPEDVTLITAAVDVQDDRFDYEIVGWGDDYKTWSLRYGQIYGDLSAFEVWDELSLLLKTTFNHPLFGEMAIRNTCIDSGGHFTQSVYRFANERARVQAIKGLAGQGRPFVGKPSTNTLDGSRVFPLGVDSIKETVVSRLKVRDQDKSGYCRFPVSYDDEYFRMLTAEEQKTKFSRGFPKKEWVKIRKRNEAFDCRVYNTAALEMCSVSLNSERRRLLRAVQKRDTPKKAKRSRANSQTSWAESWKNG
jgi:phage terminase large subunit GpA-like protein